ncbi:MAG: hypothetical protein RR945_02335 [Erysipelotrichaceae bacterium]
MKTLYKLDGTIATNDLLQLSDTETGQAVLPNKDIQYWEKSPNGILKLWGNYTTQQGVNKFVLPFLKKFISVEMVQTTNHFYNLDGVVYSITETRNDGCDVYASKFEYFNTFFYFAIGRWK